MLTVTPQEWRTFLNGGWIVVSDPTRYPSASLITNGIDYAVWHTEVITG